MNFALLGDSTAVRPLLLALRDQSHHRLTHAACLRTLLDEVLPDFPELRVCDSWSELLAVDAIDFVIIAGADPEVLEASRKLATSGLSLAFVPEFTQGLDLVYELSLIQDDTQIALVPLLLARAHPQLVLLREAIVRGDLGSVLHIEFERWCSSGGSLFQPADRDRVLLPDIDVLRWLAGNYSQVTATESWIDDAGISRATVALAGSGCPAASWTLRTAGAEQGWTVAVVGQHGAARLECDAVDGVVRLSSDTVAFPDNAVDPQSDGLRAAADSLDQLTNPTSASDVMPTWDDLIKAFETTDAARRSVRRRRTIDLHFEQTSERGLFKTQMAALGCGVLMFTMFGLIAYLIAASLFELPVPVLKVLRALWMMPLFVYLVLQLLLLIARPRNPQTDSESVTPADATTPSDST